MNTDGEKQFMDMDPQKEFPLKDHVDDKPEDYINTTISTFSKPRIKTPPPEIEIDTENIPSEATNYDPETIAMRKGDDTTKPGDKEIPITRESQLSIASNEPRMASYHEYMLLDEITRTKSEKRKKNVKGGHGDQKGKNGCMQNWNESIYKKPAVCVSMMAIFISLVISAISTAVLDTTIKEEMTQQKQTELRQRQKIIEATDWADWSAWSDCSVTCDVGLQSRDRKCNAYIDGYKFRCDGDSRNHRICFKSACKDSAWTTWSSWSSCSATCDVGKQSRSRLCVHSNPSLIVKQCGENSTDIKPCFLQACTDNEWSGWSGWSGCSSSCGVGVQTRYRRCGNPSSSVIVVVCPTGAPVETRTCVLGNCQGNKWSNSAGCNPNSCVSTVRYLPCNNPYDCNGGSMIVGCSSCSSSP